MKRCKIPPPNLRFNTWPQPEVADTPLDILLGRIIQMRVEDLF